MNVKSSETNNETFLLCLSTSRSDEAPVDGDSADARAASLKELIHIMSGKKVGAPNEMIPMLVSLPTVPKKSRFIVKSFPW